MHDYKIFDGRPIQFDLWSYVTSSEPQPLIIFWHGGGLCGSFDQAIFIGLHIEVLTHPSMVCFLGGNRRIGIPDSLRTLAKSKGWTLISPDYRLLVPASGHDMLQDVHDLFKYIAKRLPYVDTSRIAIGGGSAGAYVARLAGLYANPKPRVFFSFYGSKHILFGLLVVLVFDI